MPLGFAPMSHSDRDYSRDYREMSPNLTTYLSHDRSHQPQTQNGGAFMAPGGGGGFVSILNEDMRVKAEIQGLQPDMYQSSNGYGDHGQVEQQPVMYSDGSYYGHGQHSAHNQHTQHAQHNQHGYQNAMRHEFHTYIPTSSQSFDQPSLKSFSHQNDFDFTYSPPQYVDPSKMDHGKHAIEHGYGAMGERMAQHYSPRPYASVSATSTSTFESGKGQQYQQHQHHQSQQMQHQQHSQHPHQQHQHPHAHPHHQQQQQQQSPTQFNVHQGARSVQTVQFSDSYGVYGSSTTSIEFTRRPEEGQGQGQGQGQHGHQGQSLQVPKLQESPQLSATSVPSPTNSDDTTESGPTGGNGSNPKFMKKKKQHMCECGKSFTTSGHLSRHRKVHGTVLPFRCSFSQCDRTFARADNLRQHERLHVQRELKEAKQDVGKPAPAAAMHPTLLAGMRDLMFPTQANTQSQQARSVGGRHAVAHSGPYPIPIPGRSLQERVQGQYAAHEASQQQQQQQGVYGAGQVVSQGQDQGQQQVQQPQPQGRLPSPDQLLSGYPATTRVGSSVDPLALFTHIRSGSSNGSANGSANGSPESSDGSGGSATPNQPSLGSVGSRGSSAGTQDSGYESYAKNGGSDGTGAGQVRVEGQEEVQGMVQGQSALWQGM